MLTPEELSLIDNFRFEHRCRPERPPSVNCSKWGLPPKQWMATVGGRATTACSTAGRMATTSQMAKAKKAVRLSVV